MSEEHKSLKQIIDYRIEKLSKLKEAGVEPYPQNFTPDHFSQNIIDSYLIHQNNTITLRGDSLDGLYKPRDLDIPNDLARSNELWIINENSAFFDLNNGGSTVTFYEYGSDIQWSEYRKDSFSSHFMHTASAIAFGGNGGFANTLETQDANNNQNG